MAVYTEVSFDEAAAFLNALNLGQLQNIKGAAGGIENTNYFVDTDQGQYVLTLFERLSFEQLPFYLHLMRHLAAHGIPVPDPAGDPKGNILHELKGKPASVVSKLRGHSELAPTAAHCAGVGEALARMHLAGLDYPRRQPNLRGLDWWNETVPVVLPHLTPEQSSLILGELAYQNHVAASSACRSLPRGVVHADLFRDNVMFEDGKLTGFSTFTSPAATAFVRPRGLPQRLVHRPGHGRQGRGALRGLRGGLPGGAPPDRTGTPVAAGHATRRRPALLAVPAVGFAPAARSRRAQGARPQPLRACAA